MSFTSCELYNAEYGNGIGTSPTPHGALGEKYAAAADREAARDHQLVRARVPQHAPPPRPGRAWPRGLGGRVQRGAPRQVALRRRSALESNRRARRGIYSIRAARAARNSTVPRLRRGVMRTPPRGAWTTRAAPAPGVPARGRAPTPVARGFARRAPRSPRPHTKGPHAMIQLSGLQHRSKMGMPRVQIVRHGFHARGCASAWSGADAGWCPRPATRPRRLARGRRARRELAEAEHANRAVRAARDERGAVGRELERADRAAVARARRRARGPTRDPRALRRRPPRPAAAARPHGESASAVMASAAPSSTRVTVARAHVPQPAACVGRAAEHALPVRVPADPRHVRPVPDEQPQRVRPVRRPHARGAVVARGREVVVARGRRREAHVPEREPRRRGQARDARVRARLAHVPERDRRRRRPPRARKARAAAAAARGGRERPAGLARRPRERVHGLGVVAEHASCRAKPSPGAPPARRAGGVDRRRGRERVAHAHRPVGERRGELPRVGRRRDREQRRGRRRARRRRRRRARRVPRLAADELTAQRRRSTARARLVAAARGSAARARAPALEHACRRTSRFSAASAAPFAAVERGRRRRDAVVSRVAPPGGEGAARRRRRRGPRARSAAPRRGGGGGSHATSDVRAERRRAAARAVGARGEEAVEQRERRRPEPHAAAPARPPAQRGGLERAAQARAGRGGAEQRELLREVRRAPRPTAIWRNTAPPRACAPPASSSGEASDAESMRR